MTSEVTIFPQSCEALCGENCFSYWTLMRKGVLLPFKSSHLVLPGNLVTKALDPLPVNGGRSSEFPPENTQVKLFSVTFWKALTKGWDLKVT